LQFTQNNLLYLGLTEIHAKFSLARLFFTEVFHDKTDIKVDGLAALLGVCPDGLQRKN
jgi:hypothetical protein